MSRLLLTPKSSFFSLKNGNAIASKSFQSAILEFMFGFPEQYHTDHGRRHSRKRTRCFPDACRILFLFQLFGVHSQPSYLAYAEVALFSDATTKTVCTACNSWYSTTEIYETQARKRLCELFISFAKSKKKEHFSFGRDVHKIQMLS
jgi:hypothetical protein